MRVSQAEMDRNHERIVEGAAQVVRERGVEGTSLAEVMNAAGLTQGGFYRHFKSKELLVEAALQWAFAQRGRALETGFADHRPEEAVAHYCASYLSEGHVGNPGVGCPLAALAGDIARGSTELKAAFGAGFNGLVAYFARGLAGSPVQVQAQAMRHVSMLVGAVMIARASDPETAREVLAACRENPAL